MTSERTRRISRDRRLERPRLAGASVPAGSRAMNPEAYRAQLADLANGTRRATTRSVPTSSAIYLPHLELDADPMPLVVPAGGPTRRPSVTTWTHKRRSKKTVADSDE